MLKTVSFVSVGANQSVDAKHTQTGGEEQDIQVCDEFLIVLVEKALPCCYVTWQAHAYNFQDCLKNQQGKMTEVWM